MTGATKWAPLVLFILLGSALTYGLAKPESNTIKSKMVGVSVPSFTLPAAVPGVPGLSSSDLATGRPHLVNVFGSWCLPCMAEAPQLKQIADARVPVVGIAVRDKPKALQRFLGRYGNPFRAIGADDASQVMMAMGSSGVPESFVVDGQGRILQQQIGPINPEDVAGIVAAVKAAR